jgi:hypothetical protein
MRSERLLMKDRKFVEKVLMRSELMLMRNERLLISFDEGLASIDEKERCNWSRLKLYYVS